MRLPGSVRTRTALGATAVVAVALIVAGAIVIAVLRSGLGDASRAKAEAKAREVAAQVALASDPKDARGLDTDDPVQVVDGTGRVLAGSDKLERAAPISSVSRAGVRDRADSDDSDDGDDRDDDDRGGAMESGVAYDQANLPVDDDGQPASDPDDVAGRVDYSVAAIRATTPNGTPVTVYAGSSLAAQQQAVNDATRSMLLGLPLVLAVVGVVTWLVTRRALRPVEAIRSELAAITASDDLTRRVPVPRSRDEVAALAVTTNDTLTALEGSMERQRRFVADASHELRSPIASLRTQLEVGAAHPELLDIDGAVHDVVRLQHLAADLLFLARLDAGELRTDEEFSLTDLVRGELAQRSDPKPVELSVLPMDSSSGDRVTGSRTQIARVLVNLLDNAIRHADRSVHVTVGPGLLTVADDGPGVPEEQRERIFERFVRLDEARARDDGGAGLGLAIARGIVVRHGGTLTVRPGPRGGALFEARFP